VNCYHHPQTTAVGLCKNCSRGLCPACANDEGFGLACKGRCESEVKAVSQLIEKSKGTYARTWAIYVRAAFLYGLMGLFFLLFSRIFKNSPPELHYLFIGFGILLLLGAVLSLINAGRIKKT
jgi:hypothetical protein